MITGAASSVSELNPNPQPGPRKDIIPPQRSPRPNTTDFLFEEPYKNWAEEVEHAYAFESGFGWHTFKEIRDSGVSWANWDKRLFEAVNNQLNSITDITDIYASPSVQSGILYEQMIKTKQTGGMILDDAITKRQNELQNLPVVEAFRLLYLGLMYDEAQKLQQDTQLFAIYNGIGYAHDIVAPLFEQFPDYMDLAHIAMQGFSLGFNWGLNVGVLQAAAEAEYYRQLVCDIQYGSIQSAPEDPFFIGKSVGAKAKNYDIWTLGLGTFIILLKEKEFTMCRYLLEKAPT